MAAAHMTLQQQSILALYAVGILVVGLVVWAAVEITKRGR